MTSKLRHFAQSTINFFTSPATKAVASAVATKAIETTKNHPFLVGSLTAYAGYFFMHESPNARLLREMSELRKEIGELKEEVRSNNKAL